LYTFFYFVVNLANFFKRSALTENPSVLLPCLVRDTSLLLPLDLICINCSFSLQRPTMAGSRKWVAFLGRYQFGSGSKIDSCCSVLEQEESKEFLSSIVLTFKNFGSGLKKITGHMAPGSFCPFDQLLHSNNIEPLWDAFIFWGVLNPYKSIPIGVICHTIAGRANFPRKAKVAVGVQR
jgi:hypothetical protein